MSEDKMQKEINILRHRLGSHNVALGNVADASAQPTILIRNLIRDLSGPSREIHVASVLQQLIEAQATIALARYCAKNRRFMSEDHMNPFFINETALLGLNLPEEQKHKIIDYANYKIKNLTSGLEHYPFVQHCQMERETAISLCNAININIYETVLQLEKEALES